MLFGFPNYWRKAVPYCTSFHKQKLATPGGWVTWPRSCNNTWVALRPELRPPAPNQVCFLKKGRYLKDWQALHYGWLNDGFHSDFEETGMLHQAQPWEQPGGNALTNLTSFHQQFSALHCSQHCLHFPVSHSVSQELAMASCRQASLAPCVQPASLRGVALMMPYSEALRRPCSAGKQATGDLSNHLLLWPRAQPTQLVLIRVFQRGNKAYIYLFKTSPIAQPSLKYLEFTGPPPKTHWRCEWRTLSHNEGNLQILKI